MTRRIGPRMRQVQSYVLANPGCHMIDAARYAAPRCNGRIGLQYGYNAVHRAIYSGLVRAVVDPSHKGRTLLY